MFKLEFDPSNKQLATAIGVALVQYGTDDVKLPETETQTGENPRAPSREKLEAVTEAAEDTTRGSDEQLAHEEEAQPDETDDAPDAETPVDENGVPHNEKYCVGLKAQNKFYKSGANKGSWIKGKGVDVSAYNEWYASALPEEETKPDTSAAFGSKPTQSDAPKNFGELMKWVSEKQNAKLLDDKDLKAAFAETGLSVAQVYHGTDKEKAKKIAALHACLTATIESKG